MTRLREDANQIVTELFQRMLEEPSEMPREWQARVSSPGSAATARIVADYIAGMTDRYAINEYARIFKKKILK